jgi:hypothetical protein
MGYNMILDHIHCWHLKAVAHIQIESCCRDPCTAEREIKNEVYKSFEGGAEYNMYKDVNNRITITDNGKEIGRTTTYNDLDSNMHKVTTNKNIIDSDEPITKKSLKDMIEERRKEKLKKLPKGPSKNELAEATELMNQYRAKKNKK